MRTLTAALVSLVGIVSGYAQAPGSTTSPGEYLVCAESVWPVARSAFGPGCVHVREGKIVSVGPPDAVLKARLPVMDHPHGTIIPGLVDIHTHIGLRGDPRLSGEHNERSEQFSPHLRVVDAFDPWDPAVAHARSGGVTTVLVSPGSIAIVSGQSALLKLKAPPLSAMLIRAPAGIKATSWQKDTFTRFDKWLGGTPDGNSERPRDPATPRDAIAQSLLAREMPLIVHGAYPGGEIEPILDIVDKYRLRLIVYHCETCDENVEEFVSRGIPVVIGPRILYWNRGRSIPLPSVLRRNGLSIALSTDASDGQQKYLLEQAGLAVHYGLATEDALRSVTLGPAEMVGVGDRIGSLEPGKDADLVLLSGPLFAASTRVVRVVIEGVTMFEGGP